MHKENNPQSCYMQANMDIVSEAHQLFPKGGETVHQLMPHLTAPAKTQHITVWVRCKIFVGLL